MFAFAESGDRRKSDKICVPRTLNISRVMLEDSVKRLAFYVSGFFHFISSVFETVGMTIWENFRPSFLICDGRSLNE